MYWRICLSTVSNLLFQSVVKGCVTWVAVNFRDLLFCVCCPSSTGSAVLCLAVWRFLVKRHVCRRYHFPFHTPAPVATEDPWRPTASKHSCEWFLHRVWCSYLCIAEICWKQELQLPRSTKSVSFSSCRSRTPGIQCRHVEAKVVSVDPWDPCWPSWRDQGSVWKRATGGSLLWRHELLRR